MYNYISNSDKNKKNLLERFVRYTKIWSESSEENADKGIFPSTPQQFDFAKILEKDLIEIGMKDVQVTDDCYVYSRLPASQGMENLQSLLFLAHLDTVDEVTGKNVNPQIKDSKGFTDDPTDTIITTDGNTLLGADDKAGICAIMSALQFLTENQDVKHREVEVIFSPDEETGHGMDKVPLKLIKSKCAYTVDGGEEGELESECFNAWACKVTFTGKSCHTGSAKKDGMINSVKMASFFVQLLPRRKAPETTDKYQGFIAPMDISGGVEKTDVQLLLRAFTEREIEKEKKIIGKLSRRIEKKFKGKVNISYTHQYMNMKQKMDEYPQVVQNLKKAYNCAGVRIIQKPIRGGTDGSRLTQMGIPTPNIFTGAHNFHSRSEWCSLNQMSKSADVIINLLME
ncbi:MAG: tripeptide aminopeptidase PepT [Treponema sp.]|nr:tripeptide aminopeptidase PepT [Treponema sp.]